MSGIRTVAVIGAGTMGAGIAQVCAFHGYEVNLYDTSKEVLGRSLSRIEKSLSKFVEKGKIDENKKKEILNRLKTFTDITKNMESVDLVLEALPEKIEIKMGSYKIFEKFLKPSAIIGSNTSSIPITALAASTNRRDKFIGIHYMNPVPLMKGVEIIKGRETSEDTLEQAKSFIESLDKVPSFAVDYAGGIGARLLDIYLNEAALSVMNGNIPEEIDRAMMTCANMPMGPCKLMDMIGIDVIADLLKVLEDEWGERFKCAPILKQMVNAGHIGVKSGRGFYNYQK